MRLDLAGRPVHVAGEQPAARVHKSRTKPVVIKADIRFGLQQVWKSRWLIITPSFLGADLTPHQGLQYLRLEVPTAQGKVGT